MPFDSAPAVVNEAQAHLTVARALLAKPGGWRQGHFATDEVGLPLGASDKRAVSFCVIGAVVRAGGGCAAASRLCIALLDVLPDPYREAWPTKGPAWPTNWSAALVSYNDVPGRTQAEMLALFDRAIAACGEL